MRAPLLVVCLALATLAGSCTINLGDRRVSPPPAVSLAQPTSDAQLRVMLPREGLVALAGGASLPWQTTGGRLAIDDAVVVQFATVDAQGAPELPCNMATVARVVRVADDGALDLRIERDAGTFLFKGMQTKKGAGGQVTFARNAAFADAWTAASGAALTPLQSLQLALADVDIEDRGVFAGFAGDTGPEAIVSAKQTGMDRDWAVGLQQARPGLSIAEAVSIRRAGIDVEYVGEPCRAWRALTADELITLFRAGVPSDYVRDVAGCAPDFGVSDVVTLFRAGIASSSVVEYRHANADLTTADMVTLFRAGIGSSTYTEYAEAAPGLDASEAVTLFRAGIDGGVFREYCAAMPGLSTADAVTLFRAGIGGGMLAEYQAGVSGLTAAGAVTLFRAGVPSDYALSLHRAGYRFTANDIVTLMRSGVPASYAEQAIVPGLPHPTAEALASLYRSGVSGSYVGEVRRATQVPR